MIGQVTDNTGVGSPGWTGATGPIILGGGAKTKGDEKAKPDPEMKTDETASPLKKTLDARILPGQEDRQAGQRSALFPDGKAEDEEPGTDLRRARQPRHAPVQAPIARACATLKTHATSGSRGRKTHRRFSLPGIGRRGICRGRGAHRRGGNRAHTLHRLRPRGPRPDAARYGRAAGAGEDPQSQGGSAGPDSQRARRPGRSREGPRARAPTITW